MTDSPRDLFLDLPSQRSHLLDWGGPGGAHAVLFIHGLGSNVRTWNQVAPRVAAQFRVLALDQRSHGLTPAPADNDFSYAALCEDLHAVCSQLDLDQPVLVGHSWGGNVAIEYAVRYPDDVGGIAMLDGGFMGFSKVLGWPQFKAMVEQPRWSGASLTSYLDHARRHWGERYDASIQEEAMGNVVLRDDQTIVPHLDYDNLVRIQELEWQQDDSLYAKVKCPALFLWCVPPEPHDRIVQQSLAWKRRTAALIQTVLPQAEFKWLADSVHAVALQSPALIAEEILCFAQ